jgi:hypothetical protein
MRNLSSISDVEEREGELELRRHEALDLTWKKSPSTTSHLLEPYVCVQHTVGTRKMKRIHVKLSLNSRKKCQIM